MVPAGGYLADADGFLYEPTGQAVIIDGRHASIESTNAEARQYAERGSAVFTTWLPA
ncbi:hypothetical protein [Candidatus Neomicrothrix sp.]|uniref:hypothetical protein n=1 Tax=Candidatus Neomicrothrix sp. TaxID=2719034 RepID=UPI0025BC73EC|nr:hypothetical protein [Candidatus Microthrix sp.]